MPDLPEKKVPPQLATSAGADPGIWPSLTVGRSLLVAASRKTARSAWTETFR